MKLLHIIGLITIFMVCSLTGFSQNQAQPQKQTQVQPQKQTQAQAQSQAPAQPQSQPSAQPQTQTRVQPQSQAPAQPPSQPQAQPQSRDSNAPQRRTPRQRAAEAAATNNTPDLTERAKIKNEEASKAPAHIVWLREMYRNIDLDKDNNAALYYPVTPIGDRMNLFTTIFKLLADNKIVAYKYLFNGQELFTDDQKLNFEEGVLKNFNIPYKKEGSDNNVHYIVENSDIPSDEALIYQIKEGWYFDAATGSYKSQVLAICPMLVRKDYNVGDVTTNAVCWIPYENLRPYLSRAMIMTSNYNNVTTYSIDDFFTKGMYKGDIIKTVNMKDQSLVQQVGDNPERLKQAQDSIENQLKTFREQLWVKSDTTQVAATTDKDKKGKDSTRASVKKGSASKGSTAKEQKPKAAKTEKSPATPTRSVRRTR